MTSGVWNGGAMHVGGTNFTAVNGAAPVVNQTVKIPVRNLEGTWTSTGENPMVVTNGENPFEYHFSIAAVNPGDPTISGIIKVRDVFPEQGKESWECTNQRVAL